VSERIVVIAPNWLGDAVMALPAIGAVRRHRPDAALLVAARRSTAALFDMVAGVDEVVKLEGGLSGEVKTLAAARADIAVLLPNSFRSAWAVRRAGIAERWGYAADLRRLVLTRPVPKRRGRCHQVEYYNYLVSSLGMSVDGPPAPVVVPDAARARALALLAKHGAPEGVPLIGMAPGAAYGRAKQWPPERFGRLAALLHERLQAVTVLVGSPADRAVREELRPAPHVADLIGETDLATLAGLMTLCRAFVSNDSGAMHLAAAVGVPVTAVFGATDERGTAPTPLASASAPPHEILTTNAWCRPCMLRECPIDHRCMTGIDPARVCDAVVRQVLFRRPDSQA
jgi:heptosyltransferase II